MEINQLPRELEKNTGTIPSSDNFYTETFYKSYQEPEITILDYWRILWKKKWVILLTTLLFGALGLTFSLIYPKKYKAQATLMPLTSSGSSGLSSLANQISSIPLVGSQLGGLSSLGGGKSKELINILKSRTLAEKIIDKFNLMKIIFAKQYDANTDSYHSNWMGVVPIREDAVNVFQKKLSNIEEDKKTGLIKIEIKLKDSILAAKIANDMVSQLQSFIENNSLTLSKRNRIFIEQQLVKNGAKLLEAGKDINNFYSANRISSVLPQIDVNVGSFESLPQPFEEFQADITDPQRQNNKAGRSIEKARVEKVPGQIYLQYLSLNRELITKAHALLSQQYELAKIDEAKEDLAFQVIDKAEVRVRPFFPKFLECILVGLAGGFFLSICAAFFSEYIHYLKAKESNRLYSHANSK